MKKNFISHLVILFFAVAYCVYAGLYFYINLPPLNWHSIAFWKFLLFTLGPLSGIILYIVFGMMGLSFGRKQSQEERRWVALGKICILVLCLVIILPIGIAICTSRVFSATQYADRIKIQNVDFSEIPTVDFTKTPIIDRQSSQRLGDKVMGNMTEWVSQFNVSSEYTQISYQDSVYRVTPLTYNSFIKYLGNKENGIPAYITVDSTSGKTELVKLKDLGLDNMKVVPSAFFGENLRRTLRFRYPTTIFNSLSFEIDEQGHPWYICTTYTYLGVGTKKSVTGIILLDPITGDSTRYEIDEIPEWIDRVYPESLIVEEVDDAGSLHNGWLNSKFSQAGVTLTSVGYNYLEKNGDIWLYSGITSANSDASNLGFVLVNMRTHEAMQIASPGANETSAMSSAESQVKNYGYWATFPLLINVEGHPVYLMSLKANGLVKMHAMVSASDYQKVAVIPGEESLDSLMKKMILLLGEDETFSEADLMKKTITVSDVRMICENGTTIFYLKSEEGERFKISFKSEFEDDLAFIKIGDPLLIYYLDSDDIKAVQKIGEN